MVMGTELGIALVLTTAFLWIVGTFAILSGIDRPERKARRQERRAGRAGNRRIKYRPASGRPGSGNRGRHPRIRSLRPH
ncbi:conserved hypothetical protein [Arthrobacter sp. 9AX]|nr:conserved hypothetical protein [Arthrobacter sp. 9AX]